MSHQTSTTVETYRRRFADWRRRRPFWGGMMLLIAGFVIGYIPFHLATSFALVPNGFAYIGLVFSIFVILCGAFTLLQPQFRMFFGIAGILLSIASIFGALGGFFIGTILGIIGGSLTIAWQPPETFEDDQPELPEEDRPELPEEDRPELTEEEQPELPEADQSEIRNGDDEPAVGGAGA